VYKHNYQDNGIDDKDIDDRKELEQFIELEQYEG